MFIPSKYQKKIFEKYESTRKNMVISAVPGSGKTTTLLKLLEKKPPHKSAVFLAFNRAIADELEQKAPRDVDVMTLHSLGCKAIYAWKRGRVKVNKNLVFSSCLEFMDDWGINKDDQYSYAYLLNRILDLYKLHLCSTEQEGYELAAYHSLEARQSDVQRALWMKDWIEDHRMQGGKYQIDFTDMVYLPVVKKEIRLRSYDHIFVDECQDLNVVQQKLIEKMMKKRSRFVAVGDPNQSIYGFMGADVESFDNLSKKPNTITLPLSVSYRFGKNIAQHANSIWDTIEPYEKNDDNPVRMGSYTEAEEGDFVLCRNTKPLVELYFKYLRLHKKCWIRGNEIGEKIIRLLSETDGMQKEEGIDFLKGKLTEVYEELEEADIQNPVKHPRYVNLKEKVDIIEFIANMYDSMRRVKGVVEQMFTEEKEGIMLSTIHKSKGLESETVFILRPDLIPSEYATEPWQLRQEENLRYVAVTRAKKNLIYINDIS